LIPSIHGAAPRFDGLSDARILLRARPAGTQVEIELKRGTEMMKTDLVLRDQI
jgi:hypothetical protein